MPALQSRGRMAAAPCCTTRSSASSSSTSALVGRLAFADTTPSRGGAWRCRTARVSPRASADDDTGAPSTSGGGGQPPQRPWYDSLRKRSPQGPAPAAPPEAPTTRQGWNELRLGEKGFREFESLKRDERQRVWDGMRAVAAQRYAAGTMPPWFKPEWLEVEEAPMNTFWRQEGLEVYQDGQREAAQWLGGAGGDDDGGDGGGDGGNRGGGGGRPWWWRLWREDDPYWPLRDWGDHPMRWWTLGWGALLAAGGVASFLAHGAADSLRWGTAAGAVLLLCGMAMSDMTPGGGVHATAGGLGAAAGVGGNVIGELGVKVAWATCALLAAREYVAGWSHTRGARRARLLEARAELQRERRLGGTGAACAALCVLYAWTGMSGMSGYALPTNPGEAFKMVDIARKHKVWDDWGYGDVQMRS